MTKIAIAGFVLSLWGLLFFWASPFGAILCILGVIISLLNWRLSIAKGGIIIGTTGLLLLAILVIIG